MGFSRFTILCCILSLFFFGKSWAKTEVVEVAEPATEEKFYPSDSLLDAQSKIDNVLYPKKIEDKFKDKYKNDPDFIYDESKTKESILDRMSRRLKKWLESIFGIHDWRLDREVLELFYIIVAILIVTGVLYFIITRFFLDGVGIFSRKNKKVEIKAKELNENIHEINFPKTILDYEQQKNYRLAVRYQYLYILKKLTDKKLIEWNPEKTNEDYAKEFGNKDFRSLSYIFDYVWYGEFSIDAESYQQFKTQFEEFLV